MKGGCQGLHSSFNFSLHFFPYLGWPLGILCCHESGWSVSLHPEHFITRNSQNLLWFTSDSYFSYGKALAKSSLHLKVLNVRNVVFGSHRHARADHTQWTMLLGIYLCRPADWMQEGLWWLSHVDGISKLWNWNLKENESHQTWEKRPRIPYHESLAGARCDLLGKANSHRGMKEGTRNAWAHWSVTGLNPTKSRVHYKIRLCI